MLRDHSSIKLQGKNRDSNATMPNRHPQPVIRFICVFQEASVSDGFTWVHVHQTWLDGSEAKDNSTWVLQIVCIMPSTIQPNYYYFKQKIIQPGFSRLSALCIQQSNLITIIFCRQNKYNVKCYCSSLLNSQQYRFLLQILIVSSTL